MHWCNDEIMVVTTRWWWGWWFKPPLLTVFLIILLISIIASLSSSDCAVCILSQRNIVDIRRQILLIVVDKSNSKKGKSYRTSFCRADWRSSTLSSAGGASSQVMITDSQDQRPLRLRLQELEEGVCHHGEAEHPIIVSLQEVVSIGDFYWLLLDFNPGWRRRGRRASSCRRRWAGGCSTVIIISLTRSQWRWSWRRRKLLSRNPKVEKQCLLRRPSVLLDPRPIFILASLP